MFVALALVRLPAQITWTGTAGDHDITNNTNWTGGSFLGLGADDVIFGPTLNPIVYTPIGGAAVRNLTFNGVERSAYTIGGTWGLTLNGDVTVSTVGDVEFQGGLPLQLSNASHVFDIAADTTVTVAGTIGDAGNGALVKNGAGTLELDASESTFRGGVTLNAGWLLLGASSSYDVEITPPVRWGPIGRGTLTLNGGTIAPVADITLHNPVSLTGNTKLADCDTEYAITFAGNISGAGAFDAHGYGDINFNGNNSGWTGGITFYGDNDIYVNSATGLGTGPVSFATYENYSYLYLNASTTMNGLSGGFVTMGEGFDGSVIILNQNVALTVNQANDAEYSGSISGYNDRAPTPATDGGFTKTGAGTLTLSGGYDYWGTTQVNQGSLIVDGKDGGYFSNSAVVVNTGGTFGVQNEGSVYSTVTVNSGGKLVGDGFVTEAIIHSGATLSPGFNSGNKLGHLSFEDLTIDGGGTLEFNLKSNGAGGLFSDEITVQNSATLTINATPADRFTLKVISLDAAGNAGVLAGTYAFPSSYSWLLFNTNGIYDAASDSSTVTLGSFRIDDTQFSAGVAGAFSLSQAGNNIYLTFTPVPEPSTYALLALGLATTGCAAWRKRRRA